MNRKRWIAAAGLVLVILIGLCLFGSIMARKAWNGQQGTVGHHEPLRGFGYCSERPLKPCILAFSLNPEGGMVIHVQTDSAKEFYIQVRHAGGESRYECTRTRQNAADVDCLGATLPVGQSLSFVLISKDQDITLAEGSFPIIGMALATPEVYFTPTPILFDHAPR